MQNNLLRVLVMGVALWSTAACQQGGSQGTTASAAATPQRGALLESPPATVASYAPADLLTLLGASSLGATLLQLAYSPACSITVYQLKYQTVDPAGNLTPASGALMVPGGAAGCLGPRPVLLYAHGTTTDKAYNIANLSTSDNGEGLVLAALFAASGYIVVAPNYVGYDTSTLGYHPYLNADQQSKDMIDALAAGRSALPLTTSTVTEGGKLFVSGYSQGGYVAMATHRALQTAGVTVTASASMSGPYALAAFGDAVFAGQVNASAVLNVVLLATSYQHAYGNIYATATDVFESPYATGIDELLPSATTVSELQTQGKLPAPLFDSTPPSPAYAAIHARHGTHKSGAGVCPRIWCSIPDHRRLSRRLSDRRGRESGRRLSSADDRRAWPRRRATRCAKRSRPMICVLGGLQLPRFCAAATRIPRCSISTLS